ncbi:Aste57867_21412 [Aphanomyces stellatus]|uniref:Aste57867_21412 protein n=1 Tax=Aphanomyces stellatus TaxID=120398 RepID=A0A485LIV2_9STRA|nr:hypothetical protein As57867_021343 [Aphanomyces stellatus]VFT98083.1 Aste57867_21412 [Aphanomyces stellatus]
MKPPQPPAAASHPLVHLLQDNLRKENSRLARLAATREGGARRRLETRFEIERSRERRLVELVKEDHEAMVRSKMKKSRETGTIAPSNQENRGGRTNSQQGAAKQMTSASTSRVRNTAVQDAAFQAYLAEKLETAPRPRAIKSRHDDALTAENIEAHTAKSERYLLAEKCHLLKQLHTVLTKQQMRMLDDDQMTVRSSVSSFRSLPPVAQNYNYVPFATIQR